MPQNAKFLVFVALVLAVSGCINYGTETTTTTPAVITPPTATTPAVMQTVEVSVVRDAALGNILAGPDGRTLYIFTKDSPGKSVCEGQCLVNWPPLMADGAEIRGAGVTGTLGTITRPDGSLQVAINGMALYYWIGDTAPGQTNGQNVGGIWFVVYPDGSFIDLSKITTTTTTTTAAPTTTTAPSYGY